jgi:glycerol-3-phosphate dehydrogenase
MNGMERRLKTQVLIVGGGIVGTGLARDLALRGLECMVVEKRRINAGASGANHGLLHSGARYVSNDSPTARECCSESRLLKQLAPHCCEDTGGLFVAVAGDDETYITDFPRLCDENGISVRAVDRREAREIEPELSQDVIAAYQVEDACVDPFRLSFDNMADASAHGVRLMTRSSVVGMARAGNQVRSVRVHRHSSGDEIHIEAEQVVNASGAWVGKVAELAGLDLPVVWSKGSVLICRTRLTECVINRLRPPGDGDIVVPGGTVSLLGTTSVRVNEIEHLRIGFDEVDFLVEETAKVVPVIQNTRLLRAFAGVRPLIHFPDAINDRMISRSMQIIDHEADGVANLITVLGGKLTTFRLAAEKVADMVCRRMGVNARCLTKELPLPDASVNDWVAAGVAPSLWRRQKKLNDALLCECEMVPVSAVAQIVDQLRADGETVDLDAIRLHSRMGKGSCQGTFCGLRTMGFLYENGAYTGDQGIQDLKAFLESRWKGLRPVLWGPQLIQEQLQEAVHCGLFCLETPTR